MAFTIISNCYTIELDAPIWEGEDNKINKQLNQFQFWTDNYAVHDVGIESQPLILTGIESVHDETTADMHTRFIQLHEIMDNHEEVTISDLGNCMDGVYIRKGA